jgi:hypothetical protein
MTPSGIVTLLTDFGTRDPFVGVMKGAMLARSATLSFVDLTHAIDPQRVGDAAFWLAHAFGWFPAGSVHLAVVDPGVGTERAAVVAQGTGPGGATHWFVAPDNGVLEVVARRIPDLAARAIEPARLGLHVASRTFHGRDVFAPVAALLAAGALAFEAVGPSVALTPTTNVPEPEVQEHAAHGVVVVIDHFGNLVTNVPVPAMPAQGAPNPAEFRQQVHVTIAGRELELVGTYADVAQGAVAAVVGSFGTVEVFVRNGSAVVALGTRRGAAVSVFW